MNLCMQSINEDECILLGVYIQVINFSTENGFLSRIAEFQIPFSDLFSAIYTAHNKGSLNLFSKTFVFVALTGT